MKKKSQDKRIKDDKDDKDDLEELKIFFKVLTKRYVLAPILIMLLYILDHPNQEVIKWIQEWLRSILVF